MTTLATLILLFLSGLFTGEQETIKRGHLKTWFPQLLEGPNHWFVSWWNASAKEYQNPFYNKLAHGVLSILRDGWHFCKSMSLVFISIALSINLDMINFITSGFFTSDPVSYWLSIPGSIVCYYSILSLGFEISYSK
ncbi:MAG: hypothetical protein LCH52_08385 [Bacteroidetes bacterium]|nr:hypothetical protein [Bacteroidota bacterium]